VGIRDATIVLLLDDRGSGGGSSCLLGMMLVGRLRVAEPGRVVRVLVMCVNVSIGHHGCKSQVRLV
jgi:hypothetical protein